MIQNFQVIILSSVVLLRAIIALPLALAAVRHFQFLAQESSWLVYVVAYISIFAIEVVMTLFSLLTATFRKAGLHVAYATAATFVLIFFAVNATLLWHIQTLYTNVDVVAIWVLQVLNLASVALAESLGFMADEAKANQSVQVLAATNRLPDNIKSIKANPNIDFEDKIQALWATKYFNTQKELAKYLVTSEATISRAIKKTAAT